MNRMSLFSLIIVVEVPLVVAEGHNFLEKIFRNTKKRKLLEIFFSLN